MQRATRRGLKRSREWFRAVAEHGHWTAWFDSRPEVSFGGNTALAAAKRLVRSADDLDENTLRIVYRSDDGRMAGSRSYAPAGGSVPSAEERAGTSGWPSWRCVECAAGPEGAEGVDYRIKLKPDEREQLMKLFQSDDCPGAPVYAGIGMILNLDAGRSPEEVAKLFYAEPGVDGLLSSS